MAGSESGATPFEVQITPERVMLRVAPAQDGAPKAQLVDIQRELDKLGLKYRPETLFTIYRRARNAFEPLANREILDFAAVVQVSPDGMLAQLTVVGPPTGNDPIPPAKVKAAIAEAKLDRGLLFDELRRLMSQRILSRPMAIARGAPAKHGVDGRVDFVEPPEHKPAPSGDETIDWRERNLIRNVAQGDVIALVFPPTEGVDGFTVHGKVLKAKHGRKVPLRLGANVALSPDGRKLVAAKAGFVVNAAGKVSVEDVYQADAINLSTGNVRFSGVVSVSGPIEDAFIVEAGRGVTVGGAVGKATIKAGGDVEIRGGVHGATIEAKGSITAKFFSDCTLTAGGDILAEEYILHGTAESERAVRVAKKPDGFISGATVRAATEISAAILGSAKSEEQTRLEVGSGVSARAHFERLQPLMARHWEVFDRNRKNLAFLQESRERDGAFPEDKQHILKQLAEDTLQVRDALWEDAKQYHELLSIMGDPNAPARSVVLASNLVNAGVYVTVQRLPIQVKTPLQECAFMILDGQLKAHDFTFVEKMLKQLKRKA
jgi:hypothetical protein